MDTRDRKFGGHLMVEGASLTLFKTAIDSLSAKLNLQTNRAGDRTIGGETQERFPQRTRQDRHVATSTTTQERSKPGR